MHGHAEWAKEMRISSQCPRMRGRDGHNHDSYDGVSGQREGFVAGGERWFAQ